MNGHYSQGDIVLGNWTLTKLLGQGSFGRVFEAQREDFGTVYKAAIKIISIPFNDSEIASARAEGMNDDTICTYFRSVVEDVVNEFELMSRLKGTTNIVSYEDHVVVPHNDGIGWDVIIRMELLTPMLDHMSNHSMTRADIIKLGIDMCKALELCQRYNIIHRDIKPENIFVSAIGDYKLGDFGIARTIDKTSGGLSKKGTYTYMAPEVYKEDTYGSGVDIYSLGIVMYRLLNFNRTPFLLLPPTPITHFDRENAIMRRIGGEELSYPANADGKLAKIVLKACEYRPVDRYSNPLEMRKELEMVFSNHKEETVKTHRGDSFLSGEKLLEKTQQSVQSNLTEPTAFVNEATVSQDQSSDNQFSHRAKHKKRSNSLAIIAFLAVILTFGSVWFIRNNSNIRGSQNVESLKNVSETEMPETTSTATTRTAITEEPVLILTAEETKTATEETEPNLYPHLAIDDEGFVILDSSNVKKDELCILGYRVSNGMEIEDPYIYPDGEMFAVGFSWKNNKTITQTLVGAGRNQKFSPATIVMNKNSAIRQWKDQPWFGSKNLERGFDTTFSIIPVEGQNYYALLFCFDAKGEYVADVVLKIGYPVDVDNTEIPTSGNDVESFVQPYHGYEADESNFIPVTNNGSVPDELRVLSYNVSDGSKIDNPMVKNNGSTVGLVFSWEKALNNAHTILADYSNVNYTKEQITGIENDMIAKMKNGVISFSAVEEKVVRSLPMVPEQDCYVLLLSLNKDMNVVRHTIVKIGFSA